MVAKIRSESTIMLVISPILSMGKDIRLLTFIIREVGLGRRGGKDKGGNKLLPLCGFKDYCCDD